MGICFSFLPFFDACHRVAKLPSPMLGLGRVVLHESAEATLQFAKSNNYPALLNSPQVRSLLQDRYDINNYLESDVEGGTDITLDLEKPPPADLRGSFSTILNAGMIEYLFDQRQAFQTLHELGKPGCIFLHLAPVTWIDHSYFNFDARCFRSLAQANGYELLVEGYHIADKLFEHEECGPKFYLTFEAGASTEHAKFFSKLESNALLPARLIYMVALRKSEERPFNAPRTLLKLAYAPQATIQPNANSQSIIASVESVSSDLDQNELVQFDTAYVVKGVFKDFPQQEYNLSRDRIGQDSGHAYAYQFRTNAARSFMRFAMLSDFTLLEDGQPLIVGNFLHDAIRKRGCGRCSVWGDQLYFSTSDNSDPRSNGRRYSFMAPSYVSFIENLPPAGVERFQL